LEEALIESKVDPANIHILFKIVLEIVSRACNLKHGCSIVIDLENSNTQIPGQQLETPVDLRQEAFLDLAKSLAKVDGALHIGADLHLHAFACLLDGLAVPGEDRARGARFNSALRFTAMHDNLIVVVVSSDRPVSVIQRGVELTAQCEWNPFTECIGEPPTLEEWIRSA
jgi:DNA integrity scanning protein DisA with diadenylate cyclase activity